MGEVFDRMVQHSDVVVVVMPAHLVGPFQAWLSAMEMTTDAVMDSNILQLYVVVDKLLPDRRRGIFLSDPHRDDGLLGGPD